MNTTHINFTVNANTKGWASVGFNTAPTMAGADMYTGWVNDNTGQLTLLDTHSSGQTQPAVDTVNNILKSTGSQAGSATTFSFVRALNTGDSNDLAIGNATIYVLYAMGTSDGDANNNYAQHTSRGSGQINFMSGNVTVNNDTIAQNVTVTPVNSTGNCKFFKSFHILIY